MNTSGNPIAAMTNAQEFSPQDTTLLRIYSYYRLTLAVLMFGLFFVELENRLLGALFPELHLYTAAAYAGITLTITVLLRQIDYAASLNQLFLVFFTDILALNLIVHASGGSNTGISLLLIFTVAASAILMQRRIATLIAALAAIGLISGSLALNHYYPLLNNTIFSSGVVGCLLFTTSHILSNYSSKVRDAEIVAAEQQRAAENLQQLNQLIVKRLRTGVLVIEGGTIRAINTAAAELLDIGVIRIGSELPLVIKKQMSAWLRAPHLRTPVLSIKDKAVQLDFAQLEDGNDNRIIIFVENTDLLNQRAQQLKLASLGALTANIAHEVRNPLSAINHAAQLLDESTAIVADDKRLSEIIQKQARRVNKIIEDVQQLSRRKEPDLSQIELSQWLPQYIAEFRHNYQVEDGISFSCENEATIVFDESQLKQVIDNLCLNALRYSAADADGNCISLVVSEDREHSVPVLEVRDNGPGIDESSLGKLFEPFFTTEHSGTGLGLYISREICQANHADLEYRRTSTGQSRFLIQFSHPKRRFQTVDSIE